MGKWLKKLATVWIIIVWHIQYPTDQWQDGNSIKEWKLSPIQRFSIVQKDESCQYAPLLMHLILEVMGIREMRHLWRSPFIEDTFPDPASVTGRYSAWLWINLIVLFMPISLVLHSTHFHLLFVFFCQAVRRMWDEMIAIWSLEYKYHQLVLCVRCLKR